MTEESNQVMSLLQQGIAAIKAKNKALARDLLSQASDIDPTNVSAWFWLSAALDDPYEQEQSLQRVLELEPQNALAEKGLVLAQQRIIDSAFNRGVDAVSENNLPLARDLLSEVVERDEDNLAAWIWLSQVVESSEDQGICFNNILTLDPDNEEIREKLELLTQTQENAVENHWFIDESETEQPEEVIAPTLAGDILGAEYREKYTTIIPEPEPDPEPPSVALWTKYEDNLRCPYCGNPTEHKQHHCSSCTNPLWISKHTTESRSTLLWIVILMQAMATMILAVIPLVILFVVAQAVGIFNFFNLIPAYIGLSTSISPNIMAAAYEIFPRIYFYLSWLPTLISLIYTILLYLRWTPVYYLLLGSALLGLVASIAGITAISSFVGSIFAWGLGILISISTLIMVLKLASDFRKTRGRLYLDVDPNLNEGMDFMIRGKQYARKGMWALAAVHLRRAIALLPYAPEEYLATAVACSQIKDYDLARAVLEDAMFKDPDNVRLQQAINIINSEQNSVDSADEFKVHQNIVESGVTGAGFATDELVGLEEPVENDDPEITEFISEHTAEVTTELDEIIQSPDIIIEEDQSTDSSDFFDPDLDHSQVNDTGS